MNHSRTVLYAMIAWLATLSGGAQVWAQNGASDGAAKGAQFSPAQAPKTTTDGKGKSAPATASRDSDLASAAADSNMPDISGVWSIKSEGGAEYHDAVLRRSATNANEFVLEPLTTPASEARIPITWKSKTRRFEAPLIPGRGAVPLICELELLPDGKTMHVTMCVDAERKKEIIEKGPAETGIEPDDLKDQKWTRLSAATSDVIRPLLPAIVTVIRTTPQTGLVPPKTIEYSGVVVDGRGFILTLQPDAGNNRMQFEVRLADQTRYLAEVVASDLALGLAVLQIEPAKTIPAINLVRIRAAKKGEAVIAVPSPGQKFAHTGVVLEIARFVGPGMPLEKLIKSDVRLPLGEGGSLMVTETGDPVGIWRDIETDAKPPVSYAVPLIDALPLLAKVAVAQQSTPASAAGSPDKDVTSPAGPKQPVLKQENSAPPPPDISGKWRMGKSDGFATALIMRAKDDSRRFAIVKLSARNRSEPKQEDAFLNVEWSPAIRCYAGEIVSPNTTMRVSLEPLADGNTLRATLTPDDETRKELIKDRSIGSERELNELLNQVWTREVAAAAPAVGHMGARGMLKGAKKPGQAVKPPDIAGKWRRGKSAGFASALITRDKNDSGVYVMVHPSAPDPSTPKPEDVLLRVQWHPETRRYEGGLINPGTKSPIMVTFELLADGNSMRVEQTVDDQTRAALLKERANGSVEELNELLSQVWTRELPAAAPGVVNDPPWDTPEAPQEVKIFSLSFADPAVMAETLQTLFPKQPLQLSADRRTRSLIARGDAEILMHVEAILMRLDVDSPAMAGPAAPERPRERFLAVPDAPAARQLLERLRVQESAAALEAETIRQLQAKGAAPADQWQLAASQLKLKNLLNEAFDLKLQLEELQVKELQSRLGQLDRQMARRKELREKIIDRKIQDLIEGKAVQWESPGSAQPNPISPPGKPQASARPDPKLPPLEVATDAAPVPIRASLGSPDDGGTTQVRFGGAAGMQISVGGTSADLGSSPRQSFQRQRDKIASYAVEVQLGPRLADVVLPGKLDIYPAEATSAAFLAHNAVPLNIVEEDTEYVRAGNALTKVVYLPNPKAQQLAVPGVETLASSKLDPGKDPILEADRRGTILVVLHLVRDPRQINQPAPASRQRPGKSVPKANGTVDRVEIGKLQPELDQLPPLETVRQQRQRVTETKERVHELETKYIRDKTGVAEFLKAVEDWTTARRHLTETWNQIDPTLERVMLARTTRQSRLASLKQQVDNRSPQSAAAKALQSEIDSVLHELNALVKPVQRAAEYQRELEQVDRGDLDQTSSDADETAVPVSLEALRARMLPLMVRTLATEERARRLEADYSKTGAGAAELGSALAELAGARREQQSLWKALVPAFERWNLDYSTAEVVASSLEKKFSATMQQLAEGIATEADVKVVSESWKKAKEAASREKARLEKLNTGFGLLGSFDGREEVPLAYAPASPAGRSYHPQVAQAWLEAALDSKLELVHFDDLNLWFKAALRVRESNAQLKAGDLIVTLDRQLFETLDQAVEAFRNAAHNGQQNQGSVVLRGGLAGTSGEQKIHGERWNQNILEPASPNNAAINLEVRVRGDNNGSLETRYLVGACVAPDGLVVIPIGPQLLVADEPPVAYGEVKGIGRVVGSDEKRGLTLLKLDCPNRKMFSWIKCRSGLPATGQRLSLCLHSQNWIQDLPVLETNQAYPKSRIGNDAFAVDRPASDVVKPGALLMSVNSELQGIIFASTPSPAGESPAGRLNRHLAIPAVHIEKLINEYRAIAK